MVIDNVDIKLEGRIEVTRAEIEALEAGYLLKKTMLNKCPKKGDHIAAVQNDPGCQQFIRCQIYAKEALGHGPPGKAYRVIFGRWPG